MFALIEPRRLYHKWPNFFSYRLSLEDGGSLLASSPFEKEEYCDELDRSLYQCSIVSFSKCLIKTFELTYFFVLSRYEWIGVKVLSLVGLIYIAFYLSDLVTKLIYNKLPRRVIENTNDKAVLVTGM